MGLPAVQHRGRAGFVCARLRGDDDRAAGPDLHVLRRVAAGAAADARRGAAEGVRQQGAGADGRRCQGARRGCRSAACGEISGADGRIRGAQRRRLRQSRGARRHGRRRGVRRARAAQFPESPQAQSVVREGNLPRRRPDPVARYPRLGEVDAFQRPHQAPGDAALSAELRDDRDRVRRDQFEQMVDGLCAHADLRAARARRYADRHSRTDAHLPRAHRQGSGAGEENRRTHQARRRKARRDVRQMGRRGEEGLGRPADHAAAARAAKSGTPSKTKTGC